MSHRAACTAHLTLHWMLLSIQEPWSQGHEQVLQCPHALSWLEKLQVCSLPRSGNAVIVLLLEEEHYLPQVLFHKVTENRTWRKLQRSNSPLFPGCLAAVRKGGNTDNHQSYYSHGITQLKTAGKYLFLQKDWSNSPPLKNWSVMLVGFSSLVWHKEQKSSQCGNSNHKKSSEFFIHIKYYYENQNTAFKSQVTT